MSQVASHLRRLIVLCLLAGAFGLLEVGAIGAAAEGQGKKLEPPTLLWKSYPLEKRPSSTDQAGAQSPKPPVPARTPAEQDEFLTPALLGGIILLLTAAAVVFKRRSVPIRLPWRRRRQQLPQVVPEVVGEPGAPTVQPPAPQSVAGLLEALQPTAPRLPDPEPLPGTAASSFEEARPSRSSEPVQRQPAKEVHLREADGPLGEERETEAEGSLENQLELELWTRIADVDLVPVPGSEPQTRKEFPTPD
jgi:hypothetical protein